MLANLLLATAASCEVVGDFGHGPGARSRRRRWWAAAGVRGVRVAAAT